MQISTHAHVSIQMYVYIYLSKRKLLISKKKRTLQKNTVPRDSPGRLSGAHEWLLLPSRMGIHQGHNEQEDKQTPSPIFPFMVPQLNRSVWRVCCAGGIQHGPWPDFELEDEYHLASNIQQNHVVQHHPHMVNQLQEEDQKIQSLCQKCQKYLEQEDQENAQENKKNQQLRVRDYGFSRRSKRSCCILLKEIEDGLQKEKMDEAPSCFLWGQELLYRGWRDGANIFISCDSDSLFF